MAAAARVADEVASRGRGIRMYVARMERLFADGNLTEVDLRRVYAGAFLTFHTYFERSLERLFIGLLMSRFTKSDVRPLVNPASDQVAHAIVIGARRYVDWLPFERNTLPRAHAYFSGGRPFSALGQGDRASLKDLGLIRNALSHESSHALRQFHRRFVDGKGLPPEQRRPPGYLRGRHNVQASRLEYHIANAEQVFARLCA